MFPLPRRRPPFVNILLSLLILHCPSLISAQCKIGYALPMLGSDTKIPQIFEWNPSWDPISPAQRQLGNVSLDACKSPNYFNDSWIERENGGNEDRATANECLARDSVASSILGLSSLSLYASYLYAATTTSHPRTTIGILSPVSSIAESNTDIFHCPVTRLTAALTSTVSTGVPVLLTSTTPSTTASISSLEGILSSIIGSVKSFDCCAFSATIAFTKIPTVKTVTYGALTQFTFLTGATIPAPFPAPVTSFSTIAATLLPPPAVTTTAPAPPDDTTSSGSILSQASLSSVTGLSADGKMSLAIALPSLVVAMVGVWIAWSTLLWMKKKQEASGNGVMAPVNVNVHLQLLVV